MSRREVHEDAFFEINMPRIDYSGSGVSSINGKSGPVTLQASDVGALPDTTHIPEMVSELENDSGYLTAIPAEYITETELTAMGYLTAVPEEYITETELAAMDYATRAELPTVPTALSAFTNDTGYLTEIPAAYVTETEQAEALETKQDVWETQEMESDAATLEPNTIHVWGEVSSLAVTVPVSGMYSMRFISGASPATIALSGVVMPADFEVEANRLYEINVLDGYGVSTSWAI